MYTHEHEDAREPKERCKDRPCRPSKVLRNRYFYSMLLEAEDMGVDQEFHLGNIRRHGAELHGYGTVCGLRVIESECNETVIVRPGVALDCLGREIRVEHETKIDLHDAVRCALEKRRKEREKEHEREKRREVRPAEAPGAPGEEHHRGDDDDDEECDDEPVVLYVMLCYCEREERPLQSLGGPETCCQSACEMSRTRHCHRVVVTDEPPDPPPKRVREFIDCYLECKPEHVEKFICEWITEECWDCHPDPCEEPPCVPLARVLVVPNGRVRDIDNCCVRPLVIPTTILGELLVHLADRARRTR